MKYDSVIIGSGVAGLHAALYLARANKSLLIIEDSIIGGTTATLDLIENYPGYDSISGNELVSKMFMQVSKLGVNINFMTINAIDFDNRIVFTAETNIEYKTLIIAAGTSVNKLNIDTEKQFLFKGLSYCAVCDGSLYKNKT
jgi:thioredoxin reductase (NADPH)